IPSIDTRVVAFDEKVVDLTEIAKVDPVDVLYGIQLGGGTDINQSVVYCTKMVENPKKTLFILISDLYEGGVEAGLLARLQALKDLGVLVLVLLALTDEGMPSYNAPLGRRISALGIPCFACSPDNLPELVGGAIKGLDLMELMKRVKI
ncbi:MAG: VWA domain-containing protein, partial [Clostridiales bacterium]|nr:VWA domain-containing protein [Clostridiales bacterium]